MVRSLGCSPDTLLSVLAAPSLGNAYIILGLIAILVLYFTIGSWAWHAESEYVRRYRETRGQPPSLPDEGEWWRHLDRPWVGVGGVKARLRTFAEIAGERQEDAELERARRRALRLRRVRWALVPLTLLAVATVANCNIPPT